MFIIPKNRFRLVGEKMLKALDFFCGAGGMTRGLLDAGMDVLAGVDNHLPCRRTFEHEKNNTRPNGHAVKFIRADVTRLSASKLSELACITKNEDNLIFSGCSPCQYWSKINTSRNKSYESRELLLMFKRFVEEFNPGYVVVENVPGLRTRQKEAGLSYFLNFLKSAGYDYDEGVLSVCFYGVPQKRRRFLLIATRISHTGEQPRICLPNPDPAEDEFPEGMTVREVIGVKNGFPPVPAGYRDPTPFMHSASALSEHNRRRIRLTKKDGGDRRAWRSHPELQIEAYLEKDDCFRDVYGRMKWDEPAPTITTRFNSLSNGRFGHPEEDRAISIREGATLQTFPKDYVFVGGMPEVARQIGNAVPPELARRIGLRILEHWTSMGRSRTNGKV